MKENKILMPSNEEIEKQKMKNLLEINKINREIKKGRKRKWFLIVLTVLILFSIVKLFFGTIEISNILGYPSSNARFYKVKVNGDAISVNYTLTHRIPVIPFILNFNSSYYGGSSITGDSDTEYLSNDSNEYIIDIESYSCYSTFIKS